MAKTFIDFIQKTNISGRNKEIAIRHFVGGETKASLARAYDITATTISNVVHDAKIRAERLIAIDGVPNRQQSIHESTLSERTKNALLNAGFTNLSQVVDLVDSGRGQFFSVGSNELQNFGKTSQAELFEYLDINIFAPPKVTRPKKASVVSVPRELLIRVLNCAYENSVLVDGDRGDGDKRHRDAELSEINELIAFANASIEFPIGLE